MSREPAPICMVSIHGRIRGNQPLELGVDADTGGQTRYVVELARALGEHHPVELLTRRLVDPALDDDYAEPTEPLGENARIVRLDAATERGYLLKEQLWPHLDAFIDAAEAHLRSLPRLPRVLHGHYADAGYVVAELGRRLDLPVVFTGHSLGRIKRARLIAHGLDEDELEATYHLSTRIRAEEHALAAASFVITSTHQEIDGQWARYRNHDAAKMRVLPPGTDITRYQPPCGDEWTTEVAEELARFLTEPRKPMVLILARPDPRKNILRQVEAYASDPDLRERANLVVIAGTRDDLEALDDGPESVITELLKVIDREDLYGRVAYPKNLAGADIPVLYRYAAATRGVHCAVALTEPFGLTLLEAAASGLPVVTTADGGPTDILANCHHGVCVDPLDTDAIAAGLRQVLFDGERWLRRAIHGLDGVREHYTWQAHAKAYLDLLDQQLTPRAQHGQVLELVDATREPVTLCS